MKIRSQLTLTSTLMGSTFLITMWIIYHQTQNIEYYRRTALSQEADVIETTNLHAMIRYQISETMQIFFSRKPTVSLTQAKNSVEEYFKKLAERKDEAEHLKPIRESYERLDGKLEQAVRSFHAQDIRGAKAQMDQAFGIHFYGELVPLLQARLKKQQAAYNEMGEMLRQSIWRMKMTVFIIFGLSTLLVSVLIHHLGQSFAERLLLVLKATKRVEQGDLENQVTISGEDELSEFSVAFNQMVSSLREAQNTLLEQQSQISSQAKMSALGQMAGGIAHEINNPLAAIVADASKIQLLSEKKKLSEEELRKSTEKILMTAERIAKIIKGLRTFARDGAKDPFQEVGAFQIINETLEFCYARFKNHNVELKIGEIPTTATFECQPVQVAQVLLNLLNNAFDAVVKSSKPWVSLEVLETDHTVEFLITDSGKGISKEIADHILEPFFSTKGVGMGTGMGLSISAGIVKNHQGELFFDSAYLNTRFIARFPRRQNTTYEAA